MELVFFHFFSRRLSSFSSIPRSVSFSLLLFYYQMQHTKNALRWAVTATDPITQTFHILVHLLRYTPFSAIFHALISIFTSLIEFCWQLSFFLEPIWISVCVCVCSCASAGI